MKLKKFLIFSFFSLCIFLVPKVNALEPFEEEIRRIFFIIDRKTYDSITDIFECRLDKNSLISRGRDGYRCTLLHLFLGSYIDGLECFMKKYPDVDVNILDSWGNTALDCAIESRETVKKYLANAVDIEARLKEKDRIIELLRSAGGKTSKELAQIKSH